MFLHVKKNVRLHVNSAQFPLDVQYNFVVWTDCSIILQYRNLLTEFSGSRICKCRNTQKEHAKANRCLPETVVGTKKINPCSSLRPLRQRSKLNPWRCPLISNASLPRDR